MWQRLGNSRHSSWQTEQWQRVLWTDDSKFEIFGTRRRPFHRGGSIQVRGCISAHRPGDIVRINGILNAENCSGMESSEYTI
uniref:Uncharacterized protein n=1 Tax=Amphilophus citrinellus TaxID=61819 RepID=A0A3Q0SCW6_AMPCI